MAAAAADDPLARLEQLVAQALPHLASGDRGPPEYVPPRTPISAGEADGFFRAVDAGLFELTDDATCRPRRMRPSTAYCYPLFNWYSKAENKVSLWREWLSHAAAPAMLHLDHDYPLHDIALEVDAFDVLVYSPQNQPYIAVEVKKTLAELDSMLNKMHALDHLVLDTAYHKLPNHKQKYRGLLALRPRYFFGLAPGATRSFTVCYPTDRTLASVHLSEIETVPDFGR